MIKRIFLPWPLPPPFFSQSTEYFRTSSSKVSFTFQDGWSNTRELFTFYFQQVKQQNNLLKQQFSTGAHTTFNNPYKILSSKLLYFRMVIFLFSFLPNKHTHTLYIHSSFQTYYFYFMSFVWKYSITHSVTSLAALHPMCLLCNKLVIFLQYTKYFFLFYTCS